MRLPLLTLLILSLLIACTNSSQTEAPILPSTMDAKPNEQVAKGFVYNDLNENGTKDSDESGIPGVFVSNGIDIVQTDDAGAYSISVSDDAIIFVINRNWMTPVTSILLDFTYINQMIIRQLSTRESNPLAPYQKV